MKSHLPVHRRRGGPLCGLACLALWGCVETDDLEGRLKAQEAPAPQRALAVDQEALRHAPTAPAVGPLLTANLAAAKGPVLAPSLDWQPTRARLTPFPGGYTLAMHSEALHIVVRASTRAVERPEIADALKDEAARLRISSSHRVWSAAFSRYGVAWMVDVECAEPTSDARCADDRLVREVVDSLTLVEVPR